MKVYTEAEKQWLRENTDGRNTRDVTEDFNRTFDRALTRNTMIKLLRRLGISIGYMDRGPVKGESELFPREVGEYIHSLSGTMTGPEMHKLINEHFGTNYTERQLHNYCSNHHVRSISDGRFQKGNIPANAYRPGHKSPYTGRQYKPGYKPHNYVPVGTISEGKDFKVIKVAEPAKWIPLHKYIWEQAHGPVPPGYAVVYQDGDHRNCTLENLVCVPRVVLSSMNGAAKFHPTTDPDIRTARLTIARIRMASKLRENKK